LSRHWNKAIAFSNADKSCQWRKLPAFFMPFFPVSTIIRIFAPDNETGTAATM
jgi:hypothetical protein